MKKTIYLLNIDHYEPAITAMTYPLIYRYADRIGAEVVKITERKFPDYPVVYEKLQIYELAKERGDDWIFYIDSDCVVHPDLFDITEVLPHDTVLQYNNDFALTRFDPDDIMRKDRRFIGTCNFFTVFHKDCLELYRPLEDMTLEEALPRMHVSNQERRIGMEDGHLIDDFVITRNLAKNGFEYLTLRELLKRYNRENDEYLYHIHVLSAGEKEAAIMGMLIKWNLT